MGLSIPQQIHTLLEGKKHILVTFRADGSGDAIGSAIALVLFLNKLGKRTDLVVDDFVLPAQYSFLSGSEKIAQNFAHLQKFIITIDTKETGVHELSYDMDNEKLRVFVTPKHGFLTRDQIKTAQTKFKYDAIITVNTPDLASLGGIYTRNADLFRQTPLINICHNVANERYGQINLVDVMASTTAEVVYSLLKDMGDEKIDTDIATAILTGIIAQTRSYKGTNVKPATLSVSSELVSLGADRDAIVSKLYRTRSISTLKLWGHALEHLESDPATGLVWTSITREAFTRSGAGEGDLDDIIDEVINNSPEAKVILLLHEHTHAGEMKVHCILRSEKYLDAKKVLGAYNPSGDAREATCVVSGKTLREVEMLMREHVTKILTK